LEENARLKAGPEAYHSIRKHVCRDDPPLPGQGACACSDWLVQSLRLTLRPRAQIAAYGQCIAKNVSALEKDACAEEFARLKTCSGQALTALRAAKR
jgi:hypothetical protein